MKTLLIIMTALIAAANNGGLVKEETRMVSLTGMADEVKAIAEENYNYVEEEYGEDYHRHNSKSGESFEEDTVELSIDGELYVVRYWYGPEMGLTYVWDDCDARCGKNPSDDHSHRWSDEKRATMGEIDQYYYGYGANG